jgi:pimeloyl-ACP methyl ester carboxylesterase
MLSDIVIIQGPLVGASGMMPLADRLRATGLHVHLPDVLDGQKTPPQWSAWSTQLMRLLSLQGRRPVLVGYSASTTLAAELATRIPTQGIVFLDGDIPPATGRVTPGSERLRRRVEALDDREGRLPLWSDWFTTDEERADIGITALQADPKAWDAFKLDQPRMTRDWFRDEIDLPPWSDVAAGYVQLCRFFDRSAEEAEKRGWPVVRLKGTHLHPTLEPEETAEAILRVCRSLA